MKRNKYFPVRKNYKTRKKMCRRRRFEKKIIIRKIIEKNRKTIKQFWAIFRSADAFVFK